MAWLLLTHPAALALFWYAPRFWVTKDAAAFLANGSADSLHGVFHRQRLTWRIGFQVLVALLASLPLWGHWGAFACSSGALAALGGAYFFYDFNPRLSRARGLPEYYVSFDTQAACFPDNWLADRAKVAIPWGPQMLGYDEAQALQLRRQAWAADQLHRLTIQLVETGTLLYLALLAATILLQ